MDLRFVLTLTEHRALGFVFAPYFIRRERKNEQYVIYDRVTLQNIDSYKGILNPEEQQLVKQIEEYNDNTLTKLFSKKKITSREFIASIDDEMFEKQIRPYIERRMEKCIDILKYNPIPIYQKILHNSIYESDKLQVIDEEGNTLFNFVRDENGLRYNLSILHDGEVLKLKDSDGIVAVNQPCFFMLRNNLFIFRDINGRKLLPFLDKEHVVIPKQTEKKYLDSFVKNTIRDFNVNVEGIEIQHVEAKPKPIVSLEADMSGKLVLILKFAYEKAIYFANEITKSKVSCEFHDDQVIFKVLQRDLIFENEIISRLLSIGLKNQQGPYFLPFSKKLDSNELLGYKLVTWVNFNRGILENNGLYIAQDKLDKDFYLDDIDLKIEVNESENDWFDINAVVELKGEKIPFVKFREHIKNGNREYIMPDGKIIVLPEEWFETYGDILTFAQTEQDTIKLNKQHFSLLKKGIWIPGEDAKSKLSNLVSDTDIQIAIPETVNASLRTYQVEGLNWMHRLYDNGFGGCLADDMGLGKTLQTLTLLSSTCKDEEETSGNKPTKQTQQLSLFGEAPARQSFRSSLIIVPTSLVHNWMNEITKFTPSLKSYAFVGSSREKLEKVCAENDMVITSYGVLRNDLEQFINYNFHYVILDESQMIKNPASKTYHAVLQLKSDYRLVLTGTPIENALTDLWSQMNFLNPGLLGGLTFFKNEFQIPIERKADLEKQAKLKQLIAPFVLRRTKTEVATELPELAEQVVYCDLNEQQEIVYEREKSKARNFVIENIGKMGMNKSRVMILQSLTRLRQIANHPVLVDEDYLARSGKFEEIIRNLDNLKAEGHKALIFSSFVKHLDLVANYLDRQHINYSYLTGQTQKREEEIEKFQNSTNCTDCPFFLISLKAGGVGLNLTAADYVLILDPWWNPAAENQAISRAHRIGQKQHVMVYRFITKGTLEEKIIKLQQKKSDLADTFINENTLSNIDKDELMELFE